MGDGPSSKPWHHGKRHRHGAAVNCQHVPCRPRAGSRRKVQRRAPHVFGSAQTSQGHARRNLLGRRVCEQLVAHLGRHEATEQAITGGQTVVVWKSTFDEGDCEQQLSEVARRTAHVGPGR